MGRLGGGSGWLYCLFLISITKDHTDICLFRRQCNLKPDLMGVLVHYYQGNHCSKGITRFKQTAEFIQRAQQKCFSSLRHASYIHGFSLRCFKHHCDVKIIWQVMLSSWNWNQSSCPLFLTPLCIAVRRKPCFCYTALLCVLSQKNGVRYLLNSLGWAATTCDINSSFRHRKATVRWRDSNSPEGCGFYCRWGLVQNVQSSEGCPARFSYSCQKFREKENCKIMWFSFFWKWQKPWLFNVYLWLLWGKILWSSRNVYSVAMLIWGELLLNSRWT